MVAAGIGKDELTRVKNQLKGNLLLGLETSDSQMNRVAKNEMFFDRDISPAEVASAIDAVENDHIVELAAALLRPERMSLTLLGDLKGRQIGKEILAAA